MKLDLTGYGDFAHSTTTVGRCLGFAVVAWPLFIEPCATFFPLRALGPKDAEVLQEVVLRRSTSSTAPAATSPMCHDGTTDEGQNAKRRVQGNNITH